MLLIYFGWGSWLIPEEAGIVITSKNIFRNVPHTPPIYGFLLRKKMSFIPEFGAGVNRKS